MRERELKSCLEWFFNLEISTCSPNVLAHPAGTTIPKFQTNTSQKLSFPSPDSPRPNPSSLAARPEIANLTVRPVGAGTNLGRLLPTVVPRVPVTGLVAVLAAVVDGASVSVVGVDAAKHPAALRDDVVQEDVAGFAVVAAVAAAPHDLAVVVGVEVPDVERSEAVELEDLIGGLEGASAVDVRRAARLFDGPAGLVSR